MTTPGTPHRAARRAAAPVGGLVACLLAVTACASGPGGGPDTVPGTGSAPSVTTPAAGPSSPAPAPVTTGTLLVPVEGYTYATDNDPPTDDLARIRPRLRKYGRPLRTYRVEGPDGFTGRSMVVRLRPSVELGRNNRDVIEDLGPRLLGDDVVLTALSSVTFGLTPQREGAPTVVAVHIDGLMTVVTSEQREPLLSFVEDYIAAAE